MSESMDEFWEKRKAQQEADDVNSQKAALTEQLLRDALSETERILALTREDVRRLRKLLCYRCSPPAGLTVVRCEEHQVSL